MPRRALVVLALVLAIACGRSPLGDAVVELGEQIRESEALAQLAGPHLVVLETWTHKIDCWAQGSGAWVDWPGLKPGEVRDAALMVCEPMGSCALAPVALHAAGVDIGEACTAGGIAHVTLRIDR